MRLLFSLIKLLLLRHIRHALFRRSPKQEPNERTAEDLLFFLSADCCLFYCPFVLLLIAFLYNTNYMMDLEDNEGGGG